MLKLGWQSLVPGWWLILMLAGVSALIFYAYRPVHFSGRLRRWLPVLHALAVVLLVLLLVQPELALGLRRRTKNRLHILVDTSLSMGIKDRRGVSRLDRAREFLKARHYFRSMRPVFHTAGQELTEVSREALAGLKPEAGASRIAAAVRDLAERVGRDGAAILVLTDGADPTPPDWEGLKKNLRTPVYAVGIGESEFKDLSLAELVVNSPVYQGQTVHIGAYVRQSGYPPGLARIRLKQADRVLQESTLRDSGLFSYAEFQVPAAAAGVFEYQVEVARQPNEALTDNNTGLAVVQVVAPRIKILYLDGGLRWEYKFLKRYLESDAQLEPYFLVRVGGSLFQQTGGGKLSLPADFLSRRDFLKGFNLVILGDLDFTAFTGRQLAALRDFVLEDGGGLALLGGDNFLRGLAGTPLEALLPVALAGGESRVLTEAFSPAAAAVSQPVTFLEGLGRLPRLERRNPFRVPARGGLVLLTRDGDPGQPVAAVNLAPQGRCLVVGTDDTWRWYFSGASERQRYEEFWGRLIRYLCGPEEYLGIGRRLPDLLLDRREYGLGEPVAVRLAWRPGGPEGSPEVFWQDQSGRRERLVFKSEAASFTPPAEGLYLVGATAAGRSVFKWVTVSRSGSEWSEPGRNDAWLERLAETGGGRYLRLESAGGFGPELARGEPVTYNVSLARPARRFLLPAVFLMLNLCWFLRRRQGVI
ncbi:MAG TPA: hypothetical protein PKN80_02395 [bacterium]|uniref:VWFA domain-containing protein n=1 Tax=candidate division TA06 bacterium ADurb.Bin417 TaxID=1852828 RepID=A0A1V5MGI9_UNCT6|nr:MAG: hypothetical protein BWY73_00841 [candidate division TA06 bacterium ADurb.Bin417]HNQ34894.1 hypothetical protein [bacterium]HNS48801.1 hypothetical protein [bacterium]